MALINVNVDMATPESESKLMDSLYNLYRNGPKNYDLHGSKLPEPLRYFNVDVKIDTKYCKSPKDVRLTSEDFCRKYNLDGFRKQRIQFYSVSTVTAEVRLMGDMPAATLKFDFYNKHQSFASAMLGGLLSLYYDRYTDPNMSFEEEYDNTDYFKNMLAVILASCSTAKEEAEAKTKEITDMFAKVKM